jgi:hypothetical protein
MDTKISALPPVTTPLTGAEIIPMDQGDVTSKATAQNLASLAGILVLLFPADTYTFALTDVGCADVYEGSGGDTWLIPLNADVPFVQGSCLTIINFGGGDLTIDGAEGVVISQSGTGDTNPFTLSAVTSGMATAIYVGADNWYINGAGLTAG